MENPRLKANRAVRASIIVEREQSTEGEVALKETKDSFV